MVYSLTRLLPAYEYIIRGNRAKIKHHTSCSRGGLLGCWSNNSANSHPSPSTFSHRALCACLVPQYSYLPHWPHRQWHLANCDWVPGSYISRQPSNPRRHPTYWTLSQWSHTVSSMPCHAAWTPVHRVQTHGTSNRDNHLYLPHNILSVQLTTTTYVWRSGQITNRIWSGWTTHNTPHFHTWHRNPLEWPSQEELGSGLTASAPVLDVSTPACTNVVWRHLQPVSVAQKNKLSTMLSSNVQSVDLHMDCMAWWCWMMRQLNGCSTAAPRSRTTKQWFQQLAKPYRLQRC